MSIRNTTYLILALLGVLSCDTKQNLEPRNPNVFLKYYGGSYNEKGNAVLATSDGGYILTGTSSSEASGNNTDVYVVKTDKEGNVQFEKTFGGDDDDVGVKTVELPSGNFLVGGNIFDGLGYDIQFYELDEDGNSIRSINLVRNGENDVNELLSDFFIEGNQLELCGYLSDNSTGGPYKMLAAVLDYTQGGSTDDFSNPTPDQSAVKILTDHTNPALSIVFYNEDIGGVNKVKVGEWQQDFTPVGFLGFFDDFIGEAFAEDMIYTFDDNLVFLITKISDGGNTLVVVKHERSNTTPLWTTEIKYPGNVEGVSIYEQSDKNLVISATASSSAAQDEITIMKLDQWGNQVFSDPIYFGGLLDDESGEIIEDEKGNLVLTGTITFENKLKATLIKTNSSGELKAN